MLQISDIRQTLDMIDNQHLDIRTITMGISLRDCAHPDMASCAQKVYDKICRNPKCICQTEQELPMAAKMAEDDWRCVYCEQKIQ